MLLFLESLTERAAIVWIVLTPWLLFSLYWALVCRYVSKEKDRNVEFWTVAGFFGWFLAFLPLAVVPDLAEYESSDGQETSGGPTND